jgi:hypothetical protein
VARTESTIGGDMKGSAIRVAALAITLGGAMLVPSSAFAAIGWSAPVKIDNPAGQNTLTSISCPASSLNQQGTSFCMAVDDGGNNYDGHAVTFNGSGWGLPQVIDTSGEYGPYSVSCTSSSFCASFDGSEYGLIYNGSSWAATLVSSDAPWPVSCVSSSFCMAGAWGYDGSSWSPSPPSYYAQASAPAPMGGDSENILSISCPSLSFCVAVGHNGGADTYNGGGWSGGSYDGTGWTYDGQIDNTSGVHTLNSVSCSSGSFCVAVDGNGNALTFNGSSWSAPTSIDPNGQGLSSVSCPTSSFCMAVDGAGNALTYNGRAWSSTSIDPNGQGLTAVSCASASFCMALDSVGNAVEYGPLPAGGNTGSTLTLLGRLHVTTNGVTTRVSCTGATVCVTTQTLTTTVRTTSHGHYMGDLSAGFTAVRTIVVGSRRVRIRAGKTVAVTTTLNATGRRLLKRFGKLRVKLEITMLRSGKTVVVARRGATIRAAVRGRLHKR